MKKLMIAVLLSVVAGVLHAQDPDLLIAVKGDQKPKTNVIGWLVEPGEVYRFVRWMTQSEYLGGSLPTHDRSFIVARVGDVLIVEPVNYFRIPTAQEIEQSEAKYAKGVAEWERYKAEEAAAYARREADRKTGEVIDELRRIRRLEELRWLQGR